MAWRFCIWSERRAPMPLNPLASCLLGDVFAVRPCLAQRRPWKVFQHLQFTLNSRVGVLVFGLALCSGLVPMRMEAQVPLLLIRGKLRNELNCCIAKGLE